MAHTISSKSLSPTGSFCSLKQDTLVISALKKSDLDPLILLRVYEMEGSPVETPVEFLSRPRAFGEVNLLEEDLDRTSAQVLRSSPYAIKTIKIDLAAWEPKHRRIQR
jgi:alpha-mannosidase